MPNALFGKPKCNWMNGILSEDDGPFNISSSKYLVEEIELPERDVFGDPIRLEAREVFYKACEAAL